MSNCSLAVFTMGVPRGALVVALTSPLCRPGGSPGWSGSVEGWGLLGGHQWGDSNGPGRDTGSHRSIDRPLPGTAIGPGDVPGPDRRAPGRSIDHPRRGRTRLATCAPRPQTARSAPRRRDRPRDATAQGGQSARDRSQPADGPAYGRLRVRATCSRPHQTHPDHRRYGAGPTGAVDTVAPERVQSAAHLPGRSLLDRWARRTGSASSPLSRSARTAAACP